MARSPRPCPAAERRPSTLLVPVLALLLSGAAPGAPAVARATGDATEAPATWRVDYYHTGGLSTEVFSLDRVVVEPLPWPGSPAGNVDPGDSGAYRFRVTDAEGELLYRRGFSSIYGEWRTTAEAAERHRTFQESLRFPAPRGAARPFEIAVDERGADGAFAEVWRFTVDPRDMFVDSSPPPEQELLEIERHGAPADKVDLLLLGDGYTAAECREKFPADARHLAEVLFAHEPFHHRRDDFNVWGICPPAAESGVSRPSTGVHRRSPLGATYDAFGSERYVLSFDNRAWRDVAAWAPYEFVEILANGATYGGGGIYNLFATVAVGSDWADYIFIHEFAHHFAGLADEYYTSPVAYQPPAKIVEPWEPNVTALLDPAHLKWGDLVKAGTPVPTPWPKEAYERAEKDFQARRKEIRAAERPEFVMSALFREERAFATKLLGGAEHAGEVGAFQGANYDARVFYRPQDDCIMFSRDEVPFCAVCQRALERVIDLYARAGGPAGRP